MNYPAQDQREKFLREFFKEGTNLYEYEKVMLPEQSRQYQIHGFLKRIQGDHHPEASVLPLIRQGQKGYWYVVGFSQTQIRQIGDQLAHFFGPKYDRWKKNGANRVPQPIEKDIISLINKHWFVFMGDKKEDDKYIADVLKQLEVVWEQRPAYVRSQSQSRSPEILLRDFYTALRANLKKEAQAALLQLRKLRALDASNYLFLTIQKHLVFQEWTELASPAILQKALRLRRPPNVTSALIQALYQTELLHYEATQDYQQMLYCFQEKIYSIYANLYRDEVAWDQPEVLKSAMLVAVISDQPTPVKLYKIVEAANGQEKLQTILKGIAELAEDVGVADEGALIEVSVTVEEPVIITEGVSYARTLVNNGHYQEAVQYLKTELPSFEKARLMCECAFELNTLEAKRLALDAFYAMDKSDQIKFSQARLSRRFLKELMGLDDASQIEPHSTSMSLPHDWFSWLDQMTKPNRNRCVDWARKGAEEWEIQPIEKDQEVVDRLATKLAECLNDPQKEMILHQAFPHLFGFFRKDTSWPRPTFAKMYQTLLELLVLTTKGGEADLVLFTELTSALLEIGLDKKTYQFILDEAMVIWETYKSPHQLNWALDFAETLFMYHTLDNDHRLKFMLTVHPFVGQMYSRLSSTQLELWTLLLEDAGLLQQINEVQKFLSAETKLEDSWLQWLNNKRIGIYTLDETVSQRVQAYLEEKISRVKVFISNDLAGTKSLENMAQSSDILLLAWSCAKHAATYSIAKHRSKQAVTLYVEGKGSSSMLNILKQYVQEQEASMQER